MIKEKVSCKRVLVVLIFIGLFVFPSNNVFAQDQLKVALMEPEIDSNQFWRAVWSNWIQYEPALETLIGNDPETGEPIPQLAKDWETNEDFTIWTFYLREGIQFHHGYGEFTAQDVLHTYELHQNPESVCSVHEIWQDKVTEVEIVDDYTVKFHFIEPYPEGERLFSRTAGTMYIVSKAQWDESGLDGLEKEFAGTGAFKFKERVIGEYVLFERFDDYWGDHSPEYNELKLMWVPEEATRLTMILTGEADIAFLGPELAREAERRGRKIISSRVGTNQVALTPLWAYKSSKGPADPSPENVLLEKEVRKALNKAIDREEIIDELYHGRAKPLYVWGWHPDLLPGWNPEWEDRFEEMYGYDPDAAREILSNAGYGEGELSLTLYSYVFAGQPEIPSLIETVHQYWSEIGVDVNIVDMDFGTYQGYNRRGEVQPGVAFMRNMPIRATREFVFTWHYGGGSAGSARYTHDEIDEYYEAFINSLDFDERDDLARKIGNHIFEEYATFPLASLVTNVVVNPDVVKDWVWPGESPASLTHWYMVQMAD